MAVNLEAKARQATGETWVGDGDDAFVRALRDGSLSVAGFKMASVAAGRGFHATFGAFSTGTSHTAAAIDIDEPNAIISVPNGTCIMPIRVSAQLQTGAPSDAQEAEILLAVDQDAAVGSTTPFTATTIYNMNTLYGRASACTALSDATDSITDPVLDIELARKVLEYDVAAAGEVGVIIDLLYEPEAPPVINGPAMLICYWGGDAANAGGFAQFEWLEFPESYFA